MAERILMIDDDEQLAAMVAEYLARRLEVTRGAAARAGLALLRAAASRR